MVEGVIVYRALRDIKAGEELCISYGRIWFVDVDVDEGEGEEWEGGDEGGFLCGIEMGD